MPSKEDLTNTCIVTLEIAFNAVSELHSQFPSQETTELMGRTAKAVDLAKELI